MAAPRARPEGPIDPVPFGKYLLLEQVAQGRLGSVHRALLRRERQADETFAIKRFTPELSRDQRFTERATRVLGRAAQITHAAHCRIAEVERADDALYAALEWIAGRDLKRVALALRDRGRMMPPALVAYIGSQIAEVLAEAHALTRAGKRAPLLHGELSTTDILIGFDGRVRLIGLGSAELAVAARVDTTRLAYQAPELGQGGACSEQSDVFSLGACMLKVLSQRTATESVGDARRADSHITQIIPRSLKQIVDRSLAMRPEARWQSAAELADELQSWRSAQSQPADAAALASFMRGLFDGAEEQAEERSSRATLPNEIEPVRAGPWDDLAENTSPNVMLTEQLAASMAERARVRDAKDSEADPILQAIVNPIEPEPPPVQPAPASQVRAPSRPPLRPRPRTPSQPQARPQPQPQPLPSSAAPQPSASAPVAQEVNSVAPALVPAPAVLEAWQTEERRKPWLLPALIAGGVLLVVLVFSLSGEKKNASSAELAKSAATATPAPEPKQAPTPNAASPQAAVTPTEIEPQAEPAAVARHAHAVPSARESAVRKRERARPLRAREQPDEEPEVAPTRDEVEQPSAEAVTASPAPNEAVPTANAASPVEPSPKPTKPEPAPSVTPGPTRAATLIEQVAPRFPMRAKRMAIEQGEVTLEYTIDTSGAVKDAVVVASEPARVFEEEALKAVVQWRYQPKLVNGTPVETRRRFTFHFK